MWKLSQALPVQPFWRLHNKILISWSALCVEVNKGPGYYLKKYSRCIPSLTCEPWTPHPASEHFHFKALYIAETDTQVSTACLSLWHVRLTDRKHSPTGQRPPESSSLSQWWTPGSCSRAPPPGGSTSLPFLQGESLFRTLDRSTVCFLFMSLCVHVPFPIPLFSAPLPSKCWEKSSNMSCRRLLMTSLGSLAQVLQRNSISFR